MCCSPPGSRYCYSSPVVYQQQPPSADSISGCSRSVHTYASEVASFLLLVSSTAAQMISHQSSWLFPLLCWMTASPLCTLCLLVAISSSSRLYSKCRQRFSWPGQSSIVRLFIQACDECAMSKKTASKPVTNVLCPRRLRPSL